MNEHRSREFYGSLFLVAAVLIVVPWLVFVWKASTGLTHTSLWTSRRLVLSGWPRKDVNAHA